MHLIPRDKGTCYQSVARCKRSFGRPIARIQLGKVGGGACKRGGWGVDGLG